MLFCVYYIIINTLLYTILICVINYLFRVSLPYLFSKVVNSNSIFIFIRISSYLICVDFRSKYKSPVSGKCSIIYRYKYTIEIPNYKHNVLYNNYLFSQCNSLIKLNTTD